LRRRRHYTLLFPRGLHFHSAFSGTPAGCGGVDRDVVVDGNVITSCKPDDLPELMEQVKKHR
jgi:putative intracellular protease/amidase